MIKVFTFRRISIVTLLLFLSFVLYNYPSEINKNVIEHNNCEKINVYLVNPDDFVAMSSLEVGKDFDDKVKTIINSLIYGNEELDGVLNKDTKLLSYSVHDDMIKLNFNKYLLDVKIEDEEKIIESLIFSFTSLDNINKIMIFIEGEKLNELPLSRKRLDLYLDRSYGINKVVDINNIVDTKMVTVYYPSHNYYIPVSYVVNDSDDKINIIVKYAKSNKFSDTNLSSHLDYQVELMNYEATENEIFLEFNDVLLESVYDGKLKEEVKYALAYSIFDTLSVENVVFSVNSVKIDEFRLAN